MAELDFAMLAEFARVDAAGLLTVVGGSFDRVQTPGPGPVYPFALILRARLDEGEKSLSFEAQVTAPGKTGPVLGISGSSEVNPAAEPLDGRYYVQSVINMGVPISTAGRYTVSVLLDGALVRELPFQVSFTESG